MTNVTRVKGVFEVEVVIEDNVSQEVVEAMFTKAIATALEVPIEFVVSVTVTEIQKDLGSQRRLQESMANQTNSQGNKTKSYEVAYEIMVSGNVDVNEVMEKADRIAESGSGESQLFRQVLLSTNGLAAVGQIASKVPAHTVEEATTAAPSEEDETSWVSVLIGAIAFVLVVSCLVTTFILIKRRMASGAAHKASANPEFREV